MVIEEQRIRDQAREERRKRKDWNSDPGVSVQVSMRCKTGTLNDDREEKIAAIIDSLTQRNFVSHSLRAKRNDGACCLTARINRYSFQPWARPTLMRKYCRRSA